MPNILLQILANKALIGPVRASVAAHNGQVTWEFSQMLDPVAKIISKVPDTGEGICEMLSAEWLIGQASGTYLRDVLGTGADIDASKVRQIMQRFIAGTTLPPAMIKDPITAPAGVAEGQKHTQAAKETQVSQTSATISFLKAKGLEPDLLSTTKARRDGTKIKDWAATLAQVLSDKATGKYKMIGIWGKGKDGGLGDGHCMASQVRKDNAIVFFDPNYGEFRFNSDADFKAWLPVFWGAAGYTKFIAKMSHEYEVHNYNKK